MRQPVVEESRLEFQDESGKSEECYAQGESTLGLIQPDELQTVEFSSNLPTSRPPSESRPNYLSSRHFVNTQLICQKQSKTARSPVLQSLSVDALIRTHGLGVRIWLCWLLKRSGEMVIE